MDGQGPTSGCEPEPAPQPPRVPDHELLSIIGRGAYGDVWLARNAVGTWRAVKVVRRSTFERDEHFEREFKGLRQFEPVSRTHEGLMDILHLGRHEAGGDLYYVMELADPAPADAQNSELGTGDREPASSAPHLPSPTSHLRPYIPHTLRHELRTFGHMPVDRVIELGLRLSAALEHLHRHGLVHRDVKPSNVIFVHGEAKLADAGLVARMDDAQSLVGTAGYIAPEGPGTPRADLYGLGKLLYEAAFGKDRQEFPQLPSDLALHPEHARLLELNEVIARACAHDPEERYRSAEEVHRDLERLRQGGSVKRHHRRQTALRRFRRLGPVTALLLAGAAIIALYWPQERAVSTATAGDPTLFVLPFRNSAPYLHRPTTNETANEICARMTDALIDSLAVVDGVRVGPRKSGWVFEPEATLRKRVAQPPFQMDHVVCGRLEISNALLSGRVELHELRQDRLLWSTNLTGTTNDVVEIERGILHGVISTLRLSVTSEAQARSERVLANNWAAYLKYVEALRHYEEWTPAGYTLAMEACHQALELDPQYVDARVEVITTRRQLAESRDAPRRVWPDMRTGLREILAMDDTCYRARYWLASLQISHDYNWEEGMSGYEQLIGLNPADHLAWAVYYRWLGCWETARLEQARAEQAYPLDTTVLDHAQAARFVERDFRGCLRQSRHVQSVCPDLQLGACYWVARAAIELGEFDEALEHDLTVVTRNVRDFRTAGVRVLDLLAQRD